MNENAILKKSEPFVGPARRQRYYYDADRSVRVAWEEDDPDSRPGRIWLEELYVRPEKRRRGLGTDLLKTVLKDYPAANVFARVDTFHCQWFQSLGFGVIRADGPELNRVIAKDGTMLMVLVRNGCIGVLA